MNDYPAAHLVTGASGFLGRGLVLELLSRTPDRILCLIRPAGERAGQTRLLEALSDAVMSYGLDPALLNEAGRRCVAVEADIRDGATALQKVIEHVQGPTRLTYVWHAAASLRYLERDRLEIEETNVCGTAAMLAAARACGAERFHYVSTAFVFGGREGLLPEVPNSELAERNVYEETKIRAENLVLAASTKEFRTTIFRPSVVVGHSVSGAVSGALTGIYGLWRQLEKARPKILTDGGSWRLRMDPLATINVVPIDSVVADAVSCGLFADSPDTRIFHLTAHEPTDFGNIVRVFCEQTGLPEPEYLTGVEAAHTEWNPDEQRLHRAIAFYATYLQGDKRFLRANTDAVVGAVAARAASEIDKGRLKSLCAWYVARHVQRNVEGEW